MIEEQLKYFLDSNFNDESKFSIIKANGLSAIMESYYIDYPLSEYAKNMKSNNHVIQIAKQKQMVNILSRFNFHHVSALYFKGEVLQKSLYEDIDLRPAGDIDIYVAPEQFHTAMSVLKENGFSFRYGNTINNDHHVQYVKGHINLELHKNLFTPFIRIDEAIFFNHLVPYKYKDSECVIFDETATILHLLYHLYMDTLLAHCRFDPIMRNNAGIANRFLLRAYEIAKYAHMYTDKIDWGQLRSNINSQKLQIYFKNAMTMVCYIFPDAFPESLLNTICEKEYMAW
jgi:hypothetical protein